MGRGAKKATRRSAQLQDDATKRREAPAIEARRSLIEKAAEVGLYLQLQGLGQALNGRIVRVVCTASCTKPCWTGQSAQTLHTGCYLCALDFPSLRDEKPICVKPDNLALLDSSGCIAWNPVKSSNELTFKEGGKLANGRGVTLLYGVPVAAVEASVLTFKIANLGHWTKGAFISFGMTHAKLANKMKLFGHQSGSWGVRFRGPGEPGEVMYEWKLVATLPHHHSIQQDDIVQITVNLPGDRAEVVVYRADEVFFSHDFPAPQGEYVLGANLVHAVEFVIVDRMTPARLLLTMRPSGETTVTLTNMAGDQFAQVEIDVHQPIAHLQTQIGESVDCPFLLLLPDGRSLTNPDEVLGDAIAGCKDWDQGEAIVLAEDMT